ncbi:hypothetical protein IX51_02695 [uncultured archaeon]|nr:hypothetical protein IX51_02695 [uncultured archaeon]
MGLTEEGGNEDFEYSGDSTREIVVPLNSLELASLRLKLQDGESEVAGIRRIISESFERDAIESALSKFIEILEKLIALEKKLNRLGIDSDEESAEKVKELTASVMSVSSLKKKLERKWRSI